MKFTLESLFTLLLLLIINTSGEELNDRPIIGILTQKNHEQTKTFIAAPYVKLLEMGGARVVSIFLLLRKYFIFYYFSKVLFQIQIIYFR
jgi:hypothetical protein